ncbi:MAG: fluoride efflux transporter FluC [Candidatus Dormibacteria bacterium]
MRTLVGIMVAGAFGAAARYGVDGLVTQHVPGSFPWGTFVVNISASVLLGIVFTLTTQRLAVDAPTRLALTTGFIGSYSTFSTLMLESMRLAGSGSNGLALLNVLGSVFVGMIAVGVGMLLGRAF